MDDKDGPFGKPPPSRARNEGTVLETLRALCETSTPVTLRAAHLPISSAGHLRSASSEGVIAHLPHPPLGPLQGALGSLSFPLAGKAAGFAGPIMRVAEHPDGSMDVTLRIPERIQLAMRRAAVRVPVPVGTMTAAVVHDGRRLPVVAIDLSLHGVLIEFSGAEVPDFAEGHQQVIDLELAGKSVQLPAQVRRRDGPRYGLAFVLGDERPRVLSTIIMELQRLSNERAPR